MNNSCPRVYCSTIPINTTWLRTSIIAKSVMWYPVIFRKNERGKLGKTRRHVGSFAAQPCSPSISISRRARKIPRRMVYNQNIYSLWKNPRNYNSSFSSKRSLFSILLTVRTVLWMMSSGMRTPRRTRLLCVFQSHLVSRSCTPLSWVTKIFSVFMSQCAQCFGSLLGRVSRTEPVWTKKRSARRQKRYICRSCAREKSSISISESDWPERNSWII